MPRRHDPTNAKPSKGEKIEHKRTEAALRESEERYRMLLETMNEGLDIVDENGVIIYVNDKLCEMLGYSRDEMIGRPLTDFLDKNVQDIYKEQRARRRKGERGAYELVRTRKDGQKIFTLVSSAPIFDADGNFKGSFAVITDITGLKRKSAELELAAKEWQETFDAIIDIVILVSPDFELIRINMAGCKVVGKKPEELIGKKCYEVMHGLDAPINDCPFVKAKRTKKAEVAEFIQGGKHYIATSSPIFNKSNKLVASAHLVKDVTEFKRLQENKEKSNNMRMEELEKFAKIAVGRELRMVELKKQIKELEEKLEKITGKG